MIRMAKKLNKLFTSAFTAQDIGRILIPDQLFLADRSEEWITLKRKIEEVLEQIDKLHTNKLLGMDSIHPKNLKELKQNVINSM